MPENQVYNRISTFSNSELRVTILKYRYGLTARFGTLFSRISTGVNIRAHVEGYPTFNAPSTLANRYHSRSALSSLVITVK